MIMMYKNIDDNFVKLFDGTLNGWKIVGEGKFHIVLENEEALLQTEGGMGLLWYYKKKFKDFILKLEWKVSRKEDNSGVFVRFDDPQGDPWSAVKMGYEIQIDDLGQPDGNPVHMTGAIYTFRGPFKMVSKFGQWNSLEIQAIGQKYNVIVNGEKVVDDFIGNRLTEGYVGLQNHDDNSKVFFRNIMIKEL
jgi:hypothetical protein